MNKTESYKRIMSRRGFASFKALIGKWERLSENLEGRRAGLPIILPDLLLVSRSGTGRSQLLRLLSDYLCEEGKLMSFSGSVTYFEFLLGYCPPSQGFSELPRLMEEVSRAAGFRGEYRGIIFIDIDEWRDHFEEKYFEIFLEYVADNSDEWLVVFSLTPRRGYDAHNIEALISSYLRIERVEIEPPTPEELLEYAGELLDGYGLRLTPRARAVIGASIETLSRNRYYDGYKTVKILCRDLAYNTYVDGYRHAGLLSEEAVAKFAKDSEYISSLLVKIEKTNKIGFC